MASMKRKILITLVLFLLLLPFVSWYYLRSGLLWRKEAQARMSGTTSLPRLPLVDFSGNAVPAELTKDHVSLLTIVPCQPDTAWTDLLAKFYRQFKETGKAQFVLFDSCTLSGFLPDSTWTATYHIPCSSDACAALLGNWPEDKPFALVDRQQVVRAYYRAETREEKRILLEDMALLLPRERTEKLELRRGETH